MEPSPNNPFNLPPAYLNENNGYRLQQVAIVFAVLETVAIILYFIARIYHHNIRGIDVYMIVPAYLCCLSLVVLSIVSYQIAGVGRHMYAVPDKLVLWLKLKLVVEFTYLHALLFVKLTMLFFYLRIFTIGRLRYATYAIMGLVVATYFAMLILELAVCRPFAYQYNKTIPGGHCGDIIAMYRHVSWPNIISDFAILILPLPFIWKMKARKGQKIGLTITFLLGSLREMILTLDLSGIVTAIIRFVTYYTTNIFEDVTWHSTNIMIWTTVEVGVYLITACLPSMRPLMKLIFKNTSFISFTSQLSGRISNLPSFVKSHTSTTDSNSIPMSTMGEPKARNISVVNSMNRSGFQRMNETNSSQNLWEQDRETTSWLYDEPELQHPANQPVVQYDHIASRTRL